MGTIYIIKCLKNNKCYVGKTTRTIDIRWWEHKHAAETGAIYPLYSAMRKYGINAFEITTLSTVSDELLDQAERDAIRENKSHVSKGGYNLTFGGEGTSGFKRDPVACSGERNPFYGRRHSQATKDKIRNALLTRADRIGRKHRKRIKINGRVVNRVPENERRSKISKSLKSAWKFRKHPMLGKKHTEQSKERMRQAHLGKKMRQETKDKISNAQKGSIRQPASDETRKRMSLAAKNRKIEPRAKQVEKLTLDGLVLQRFMCLNDAYAHMNVTSRLIKECCEGRRESAYGFLWRFMIYA